MATYDDWMDVYEDVYAAFPADAGVACPNCGHHALRLVYTGNLDRDIGYGAFWCDDCLHGVGICRAVIPDGAIVRDIKLPREERVPRIPDFTLVE
jgi:hypothetical protein